jgi:hypothetical protein
MIRGALQLISDGLVCPVCVCCGGSLGFNPSRCTHHCQDQGIVSLSARPPSVRPRRKPQEGQPRRNSKKFVADTISECVLLPESSIQATRRLRLDAHLYTRCFLFNSPHIVALARLSAFLHIFIGFISQIIKKQDSKVRQ